MLTFSMTIKEMYDHLCKDKEKIEYRENYFRPKAIKEFRKARKFPAWVCYDYKVPKTGNRYVIFYYAANQTCIEKPTPGLFAVIYSDNVRFVVKWVAGGYKHTPNSKIELVRQLHVFESHFFQRYNQRVLKDETLTSNDIACLYFSRNPIEKIMPIEINEEINRNIKKYGEGGDRGYKVKDGVCFTRMNMEGVFHGTEPHEDDIVDAMIILYKTFVSESMMHEGQIVAVEKEYKEKEERAYEEILKESKDGVLELQLEP